MSDRQERNENLENHVVGKLVVIDVKCNKKSTSPKVRRDRTYKGSTNRRKRTWKKRDLIEILAEVHKENLLI
jgi:hypothetical protein